MIFRIRRCEFREARARHRRGRNSELCFKNSAMLGDTRRATISAADPQNGRMPFEPNFRVKVRIA